jgi:hypothetical protein
MILPEGRSQGSKEYEGSIILVVAGRWPKEKMAHELNCKKIPNLPIGLALTTVNISLWQKRRQAKLDR